MALSLSGFSCCNLGLILMISVLTCFEKSFEIINTN